MSGGAGSVFDMIARIAQNNKMRKQHHHYFDIAKETMGHEPTKNQWCHSTPEQLVEIQRIIACDKKRKRIVLIIAFSITVLVVFGLVFLIHNLLLN